MMQSIFDSVAVAASSPLALVAYAVAVAGWAFTVVRTRQLRTIKDLPEKDRKSAIQRDYGETVKGGITGEQWLESKKHFYFFIGFLATLVAIVAIIALTIANKRNDSVPIDHPPNTAEGRKSPDSVQNVQPVASNPGAVKFDKPGSSTSQAPNKPPAPKQTPAVLPVQPTATVPQRPQFLRDVRDVQMLMLGVSSRVTNGKYFASAQDYAAAADSAIAEGHRCRALVQTVGSQFRAIVKSGLDAFDFTKKVDSVGVASSRAITAFSQGVQDLEKCLDAKLYDNNFNVEIPAIWASNTNPEAKNTVINAFVTTDSGEPAACSGAEIPADWQSLNQKGVVCWRAPSRDCKTLGVQIVINMVQPGLDPTKIASLKPAVVHIQQRGRSIEVPSAYEFNSVDLGTCPRYNPS